jgi:molecular chaperone DnaJ
VRKRGVPVLNGTGRGDLFVEIRVATPEKLTRQQRELLEALAQTLGQENKPQKRTLLNKMKDIFN